MIVEFFFASEIPPLRLLPFEIFYPYHGPSQLSAQEDLRFLTFPLVSWSLCGQNEHLPVPRTSSRSTKPSTSFWQFKVSVTTMNGQLLSQGIFGLENLKRSWVRPTLSKSPTFFLKTFMRISPLPKSVRKKLSRLYKKTRKEAV
jgi:hypothetical protein